MDDFPIKPGMHGHGIRSGHPLGIGLEAFWPFAEGGGNTIRNVHGGFGTGVFYGDVAWVATPFGPGLYFPGTDDWIDLDGAKGFADTDPHTYVAILYGGLGDWIFCNSHATYYGTSFSTYGNKITFWSGDGSSLTSSATALSATVWQMLSVTYNGDKADAAGVKFYRDGNADGTGQAKAAGWGASNLTQSKRIGAWWNGGYDLGGTLGMLASWSRALSASEIEWLYRDPWDIITHPTKVYLFYGALATVNRRRRVLICGRRRA